MKRELRFNVVSFLFKLLGIKEGYILPWYGVFIRFMFFPYETLSSVVCSKVGYQWQSNTWTIYGTAYTDDFFRFISGEVGNNITIKKTVANGKKVFIFEVKENA